MIYRFDLMKKLERPYCWYEKIRAHLRHNPTIYAIMVNLIDEVREVEYERGYRAAKAGRRPITEDVVMQTKPATQ